MDAAVGVSASASVLASTDLWLRWANIALRHAPLAEDAARQVAETDQSDQPKFGDLMLVELEHSMIALAASAHAIDGFDLELRNLVEIPDALRPKKGNDDERPRARWILARLRAGFDVEDRADEWAEQLEWLFNERRNPIVHPYDEPAPTVPHPTADTNVAQAHVNYSASESRRAVVFMRDVLGECLQRPGAENEPLVSRIDGMRRAFEALEALQYE
jgi:hypothetical protein